MEWQNYEATAELYDENYVNSFGTGPAARVDPVRRYHQAFPNLHLKVEEVIVAGDTVVLRATFRGTNTGGYVATRSGTQLYSPVKRNSACQGSAGWTTSQ